MNNVRNLFDLGLFISRGILLTAALFLFFVGYAAGATITFDKSLDVPDRDFTVTYEGSTFSFTVADIGNYKIGDPVGVTVSGGVSNMRLVLFTVDKITPWFKTFYATSGSISTTISADRFDSNCPDVCDDGSGGYKMGPGIYALAVQNRDDSNYFIAKPVIVSNYDLTATPNIKQVSPGSTIKVTVTVSKNGTPVSVAPNNVDVEFVQDSTRTHFGNNAITTATGTYEANIQIPSTASGSYRLYAAITTNRILYQGYPELIGAAGYSGTIAVSTPTAPFTTPTATPSTTPAVTPSITPTATPPTTPAATPVIEVTETVTPIETTPAAVPTKKEVPGFEAAVALLAITLLAGSLIRGRKRR
ncbi:MAG: hypothetical protein ABOK23_13225 [Candidatus Methanoperedens sp.]|nr:hypothetical protein [Candidatus Methanoperedens sp.]MCZ7395478.1 hypothetical protein [Candidatus Methanoperedens sp.]